VHAAPPVRVDLGRGRGWPVFVGFCAGAAVGNTSAWWLLREEAASPLPVGLLAGVVAGLIAFWTCYRAQAVGVLQWDGAQWQWRGAAGQAHVTIDLGGWLLLRFEPQDGLRQWIAAAQGQADGPWPALRAALYSSRSADPLDAPPA
jgi:hypothetical protein